MARNRKRQIENKYGSIENQPVQFGTEEYISIRNELGIMEPTPWAAVRNIIQNEQRNYGMTRKAL